MLLKHFFIPKLAHSSYLLAGDRTCAIVDPSRDVQVYLDAAEELDLRITHILETHLHADFISGHMDLAKSTGAEIYAPASAECEFPHRPLSEGDVFRLEDMALRIIETPGHTPEHISYVVTDTSRGDDPVGVFCGDTLFVGDVGRPDLFPGRARELADRLYDSLAKLMALPDFCEVYPAHGAGSLCGRSMGAKWRSTIGFERRYNPALQIGDREEFIRSLTTDMPPAPDHFSRCSDINRRGPALVSSFDPLSKLSPGDFREAAGKDGSFVLDVRRYDAFGGQHVPGSWSIDFTGNLPTFAGWVVPPDRDIYLVATDAEEARQTVVWLRRVGLDRARGWLDGGMFAWATYGLPTAHLPQLSVLEAGELHSDGMRLLDVRASSEFEDSHVGGAENLPAPDLRARSDELDRDEDIMIVCSTGHRSTLAASILMSMGFSRLHNVAGGMKGLSAAALAPACVMCSIPHGPKLLVRKVGDTVEKPRVG
ncbi:MAG: MBL fold metallo-hydrolase [Candidatus Aegiribacteria sp. MLS_C]|nr:MAG: MBL fold metallo-hydrolase [Candidatus Aegiribacteria sp. MLS_C]